MLLAKTLCTTNRMILYDLDSKTKRIEITGDSFGQLKGATYKSLSELEKVVYNNHNDNSAKKEIKKLPYEHSKKH